MPNKWTPETVAQLVSLHAGMATPAAIAVALDVTVGAVTSKLARLRAAEDVRVLMADLTRDMMAAMGQPPVTTARLARLLAHDAGR